jgi:16S rRNA (guanine966-N2)-methyltransferase
MMRIIAGKWRSRKLHRPATSGTRPMPDRVKEAIFASLSAHYECPGEMPSIRVADAFAGSGSMGLEALSRGASACWFLEQGREALLALRKNLSALEAGPSATIVARDAWRAAVAAPDGRPFDLIFLDPPYAHQENAKGAGPLERFLDRCCETDDNRPIIVFHHPKRMRIAECPANDWRATERKEFGTNAVTYLMR